MSAFLKENGCRPRIVVFTQGKDATTVASHGKVLKPAPILLLPVTGTVLDSRHPGLVLQESRHSEACHSEHSH